MKQRFRYLDERGQQVEVEDLEALREHVHAGRVDDDTLLYDSLTDEWAPASAHSAYRLLDDPMAGGSATSKEAGSDGPTSETATTAGESQTPDRAQEDPVPALSGLGGGSHEPEFPDLDLALAPDDDLESTDEVVEKLLRERERDRGANRIPSDSGSFSSETRASRSSERTGSGGAATPHTDPWGPPERARGPLPPDPDDEPIASPRRRRRKAPAPRNRKGSRASTRSWRRVEVPGPVLVVVAVLVVALGLYSVTRTVDASGSAEASTGSGDSADAAVRTSSNSTWAAAEGGAFRDMMEGVDSLRGVHSVQRMPLAWLSGPYLADAGTFVQIRDYWRNYLGYVDAVRSQDTALFRRSFVHRLEEQGVSGPIASIRLARALDSFRASQPARDTVYERMEDLAEAALDLHELLAERADDIVYDPVTEERASRQPILEAWSDDAFLRKSIWALLDRITANLALLEYDAGAGRSDLTERLFQELRVRSVGEDGGGG